MLLTDQHPKNKSIMISILGKPNVGKSSLINHLIGFDLSIVSQKPQTTRNQFHCAFTIDHTEIILVDSPGVHKSTQELNKRMNGQAQFANEGADLNFLLVDMTQDIESEVKDFMKNFESKLNRTWVIFTKSDIVKKDLNLAEKFLKIKELIPTAEKFYSISSLTGDNIHALTGDIVDAAIPGPHFYPDGDVSNKNERFFVTEYIREQAISILNDELPYEIAVIIDEFKDMKIKKEFDAEKKIEKFADKPAEKSLDKISDKKDKKNVEITSHISASIIVNRPSQRAIVVGRQGTVIKQIGTNARRKIEAMMGGKVHLNLHVKVSPKWFKNNFVLEELGLPRVQTSARVWRNN